MFPNREITLYDPFYLSIPLPPPPSKTISFPLLFDREHIHLPYPIKCIPFHLPDYE